MGNNIIGMALHRNTLSWEPKPRTKNYYRPPQIGEVIRSTLPHQLKQHNAPSSHSPERNLIARTKKLLQYDSASERYSSYSKTMTQRLSASGEGKEIASGSFSGSRDGRRGMTARMKSRRDNRMNATKRQLQLLNDMAKHSNKDQLKRFQAELQMEESEIHSVVAQYRLRRKWVNSRNGQVGSLKDTALSQPERMERLERREIREANEANEDKGDKEVKCDKMGKVGKMQQSRVFSRPGTTQRRYIQEVQLDVSLDHVHPYRRLLLPRRSKGKLQPWVPSSKS